MGLSVKEEFIRQGTLRIKLCVTVKKQLKRSTCHGWSRTMQKQGRQNASVVCVMTCMCGVSADCGHCCMRVRRKRGGSG